MRRRIDIKALLADETKRRELMVRALIATQAREGIVTTRKQAEAAYDKVQKERGRREMREGQSEDGKFIAVVRDSSESFATNALRFDTAEAALEYVKDLAWRWTAVREYAVIPSDTPRDVKDSWWSRETVERVAVIGITAA